MGWAEPVPESVSRMAVSSAKAGEVVKVLWRSRVGRTEVRGVLGCGVLLIRSLRTNESRANFNIHISRTRGHEMELNSFRFNVETTVQGHVQSHI
jgi:hypothetical protein